MINLDTFAFDSRRHADYRFALAFYINGLISCRVSVCCEFKHKKNAPLGGPTGSFAIHDVLHSKPCEKCVREFSGREILIDFIFKSCQFEQMKRKMKRKPKRLDPPGKPPYDKSVVPKRSPRGSRTPSPTGNRRPSTPSSKGGSPTAPKIPRDEGMRINFFSV